MSSAMKTSPDTTKRIRLTREQRLSQLIDVAWKLVREEGTDVLTLPRLAEEAAVAKPVVYDHFGTRNGLLAALYQDFDGRQTVVMDAAIAESAPTLEATARTIASSYVDCVLTQGREIPGVLAALAGSPELAAVKRAYRLLYIDKCRTVLEPFTGADGIAQAGFWAMLGAADGLSEAAATAEITAEEAKDELYETIAAMVERSRR
ncbi:helix-turn-helix domain-containing protein [Ensifer sp.]|uniref:TetR/AcrR family transcriptional regulator n=1 Tax=Ensifer sp. TaxID=1872086 RepID=UPI002E10361F|nr:helix-turn-helix domain-containing protein [Ensifer sp.]